MSDTMLSEGKISPKDLKLLYVSDDPQEICDLVCKAYKSNYRLEKENPNREKSIR
jgi:predicted Rossmann-fold nucleotide-binding protein